MKFLLLSLCVAALAGCQPETASTTPTPAPTDATPVATQEPTKTETPAAKDMIGEKSELRDSTPLEGEEVAVLDTKYGKIVFRFFADKAPKHVESFKKLANAGFYNGTTFHRVIPGFMIQGGDPNSKDEDRSNDGQGGPGFNLPAEFNEIAHVRGVVSMARAQDPNSAGSQFFIVQKDSNFLDTQYTAWGQVVKSGKEAAGKTSEYLAIVDKIVMQPRDENDNPKERIEMKVSVQKWPLK